MQLHWLCSQPTPYNNFLFTALAKDGGVDLTVHFRQVRWPSHPWRRVIDGDYQWRCYKRKIGVDAQLLRRAAAARSDLFVIGGWNEPTMLAVILMRIVRRLPFAVWSDTPDRRPRPRARKYAHRGLLKLLCGSADKFMVTGEIGATILREIGCPPDKIVVFPYWVPLPPASLVASSWVARRVDVGPVRFVGLGRLERVKGYAVALSALERVVRGMGLGSAHLTIVGEGPERRSLQKLMKGAGLDGFVDFLGWQEHTAAMEVLEQSDVLIHPAEWEPYGVAILEAMARGKPVIASDMSMAGVDRITHGTSGFIFRTGDADEMANYMQEFVVERARIARMGAEARKIAEAWPVSRAIEIVKGMIGNVAGTET